VLCRYRHSTDNTVGLIHTTGPKLSTLARKYRPLVPVLRELILRADTPLDFDAKDMIVGQLDTAEDRFAAIWDLRHAKVELTAGSIAGRCPIQVTAPFGPAVTRAQAV
jgi:hypothetical protein